MAVPAPASLRPGRARPRWAGTRLSADRRPAGPGTDRQRVTGFLEALGKKAAERWLVLLVLPGVLWLATALVAVHLGHRNALHPGVVVDWISRWTKVPHPSGLLVAILAGTLVGSAAAGLVATGVGWVLRRAWLTSGRRRPARWLVEWRRARWRRESRRVEVLVAEAIAAAGTASEVVTGP